MKDAFLLISGLFCIIYPIYCYFSGHPYESMKKLLYMFNFWEKVFGRRFAKGYVLFVSMPVMILLGCVFVGIVVLRWFF